MKLSQRAERLLDVPEGTLTGILHIEIDGVHRLIMEGDCEIREYEDTVVRVEAKPCSVRITGHGLCLEHLRSDGIGVTGTLLCVEFIS